MDFALRGRRLSGGLRLAWAAEFSADFVQTGGPIPVTGTLYFKGKDARQEATEGKSKSIVIVNGDRLKRWALNPAKKGYSEHAIAPIDLSAELDNLREKPPTPSSKSGLTITREGTETVSGYPCEKIVVRGKGLKAISWYSKKLDLVIKTEITRTGSSGRSETSRLEFKNIKERKLPASLFEVPKGYKQFKPQGKPSPATAPKRGVK